MDGLQMMFAEAKSIGYAKLAAISIGGAAYFIFMLNVAHFGFAAISQMMGVTL